MNFKQKALKLKQSFLYFSFLKLKVETINYLLLTPTGIQPFISGITEVTAPK